LSRVIVGADAGKVRLFVRGFAEGAENKGGGFHSPQPLALNVTHDDAHSVRRGDDSVEVATDASLGIC
jgi:hypothetical protein